MALFRPPAVDAPMASTSGHQTAVIAGGRFWGIQAVFQHAKGVIRPTSGYSGGSAKTAEYELVRTGETGHYFTAMNGARLSSKMSLRKKDFDSPLALGQLFDISLTNLDDPDPHH
jgi:hypothetical protein